MKMWSGRFRQPLDAEELARVAELYERNFDVTPVEA